MKLIKRPRYIGKEKEEKYKEWNEQYGKGNWYFKWKFGEHLLDFWQACLIYEDAYFMDSLKREKLWKHLFSIAKNFYDNSQTNIDSGLNYNVQESSSTHLQDIAVRRVGIRRGWKMEGKIYVQIRGPESKGYELMPGKIDFHLPKLIEKPDISPIWANPKSVESFYQNNRWLTIIKKIKSQSGK